MNILKPAAASLIALALPCVIFAIYTDSNISERLFVERLGCGCHPFFNANHLSLIIGVFTATISFLLLWSASHQFALRWRNSYRAITGVYALLFLRFFMMKNYWL